MGWQAHLTAGYDQNDYGLDGSGSYYGLCSDRPNCFYSDVGAGLDAFGNPEPASASLSVTGLVLEFDVEVGGTYSLFTFLDTSYSNAGGLGPSGAPSAAVADFLHTFGGTVRTEGTEVTLDWATPLVAVPEPRVGATWRAGLSRALPPAAAAPVLPARACLGRAAR